MAQGTFFITSRTQTPMFQTERSAELFLDVVQSYRRQHKFLFHAFVVMPEQLRSLQPQRLKAHSGNPSSRTEVRGLPFSST